MHDVRLYFDFLSPYSALAFFRAEAFQREHDVRFALRPVPIAAMLDAAGVQGTGEVPEKKAVAAQDLMRTAQELGIPLSAPPATPFVSLHALRLQTAFVDHELALPLAVALFHAAWIDERDLTDFEVLQDVARAVGVLGADEEVEAVLRDRAVKKRLKAFSEESVALKLFGVPSFVWGEEIFWGQDRMGQLAKRLSGELDSPLERARELLARPVGFDRSKLKSF